VPAEAEGQSAIEGVKVTVIYQDRGRPVVALPRSAVNYRALTGSRKFSTTFLEVFSSPGSLPDSGCVFHLHGLWSPALHSAASFARKRGLPYVVSIRGMLADWAMAHKALKKKIAWRLYQKSDLESAECLLASSEFEAQDVVKRLPASRVVVIPNGCGEPPTCSTESTTLPGSGDVRWALAIGRLHPVKGFVELIEAWANLSPHGWKLAIAGPDEAGYRAVLEKRIRAFDLGDKVFLLGEVDDSEKWSLLRQCELFIAPSKTENFGMAIAEALQSGTPVITTTGTPWRAIQEHGCGWWIKPGASELKRTLRQATNISPEELREKGAAGGTLIRENYSWDHIAAKSVALYRSILVSRS